LSYGYKVIGKSNVLCCLEVPFSDPNNTSQKIIFSQLKKIATLAESYNLLDLFIDRAEYFYLQYVSTLPDKMFVKVYKYVKDIFTPCNNAGEPDDMVKVTMGGHVINKFPEYINIPVNENTTKDSMVKILKSLQSKISRVQSAKGQCGFSLGVLSKTDYATYFFVLLLLRLPDNVVPVVHGYTGNMSVLSGLVSFFKKKIYFSDSVERPRYYSSKKAFNDYMVLYDKPLDNAWMINYGVPFVDFNSKKTEHMIAEFKKDGEVTKYKMFRCDIDMCTSYLKGFSDFSSPKTVWIMEEGGGDLSNALEGMIAYFTTQWMFGSYVSYNVMQEFGFLPFTIAKSHDVDIQDVEYKKFKGAMKKEKQSDVPIREVELRRPRKDEKKESISHIDGFGEFDDYISNMNATTSSIARKKKKEDPSFVDKIAAPDTNVKNISVKSSKGFDDFQGEQGVPRNSDRSGGFDQEQDPTYELREAMERAGVPTHLIHAAVSASFKTNDSRGVEDDDSVEDFSDESEEEVQEVPLNRYRPKKV